MKAMNQSRPCVVLPTLHQLDAIGGRGELAEVAERIFVGGEVEIVAGLVAQHRFGRGDLGERRGGEAASSHG